MNGDKDGLWAEYRRRRELAGRVPALREAETRMREWLGQNPNPINWTEDVIKSWQQMLRGIQMWHKSRQELMGWATERKPEKPTVEGMAGYVSPWANWARQAGAKGLEYLQKPFTRWGR